jgi:hypothetical protein
VDAYKDPSGVLTIDLASLMLLPIKLHAILGGPGLAVREKTWSASEPKSPRH